MPILLAYYGLDALEACAIRYEPLDTLQLQKAADESYRMPDKANALRHSSGNPRRGLLYDLPYPCLPVVLSLLPAFYFFPAQFEAYRFEIRGKLAGILVEFLT